MGRKHCGKKRNCSLRAISPFPTMFSKGLFPRGVKRCYCVGMGLSDIILKFSKFKGIGDNKIRVTQSIRQLGVENTVGKAEDAG